jgi:hypothetical protein
MEAKVVGKSTRTRNITQMKSSLDTILQNLLLSAKIQKRRKKERLIDLGGDWVKVPSRGPLLSNGKKCLRWHFWKAAQTKHQKITQQITDFKTLLNK